MSASKRTRLAYLVAASLCAAAVSGCGTPATVTPSEDPLPGLTHDVQAARNAVTQSQAGLRISTGATP